MIKGDPLRGNGGFKESYESTFEIVKQMLEIAELNLDATHAFFVCMKKRKVVKPLEMSSLSKKFLPSSSSLHDQGLFLPSTLT